MAEYVRYPKNAVISRVPEEMPLEKALLIEPYGCSKHAVDRAQIGSEDVVVISGAGTLGLGMITYARMRNPALLIALDLADNRGYENTPPRSSGCRRTGRRTRRSERPREPRGKSC